MSLKEDAYAAKVVLLFLHDASHIVRDARNRCVNSVLHCRNVCVFLAGKLRLMSLRISIYLSKVQRKTGVDWLDVSVCQSYCGKVQNKCMKVGMSV